MWCGRKRRPIVDLKIYTKNRTFRVPGSSKWKDYHPLPLPSLQFFIDTRMADRRTRPDWLTPQLTIPRVANIQNSSKRSWENCEDKMEGHSLISNALSVVRSTSETAVTRISKRRRVFTKTVSIASSSIPEATKMNYRASKSWKVAGPTPGPCSVLTRNRNLQKTCPKETIKPEAVKPRNVEMRNSDELSDVKGDNKTLGRIGCPVTGC